MGVAPRLEPLNIAIATTSRDPAVLDVTHQAVVTHLEVVTHRIGTEWMCLGNWVNYQALDSPF